MPKVFTGIRPADPARYVRGEQPYGYAQCKREIRVHVDAVLAWSTWRSKQSYPGIGGTKWRKDQAAEDVLAMALETIACKRIDDESTLRAIADDCEERHKDLLLARYALKQARRIR